MIINEQNMARGLKKESLNNKGLRFIMQKKSFKFIQSVNVTQME